MTLDRWLALAGILLSLPGFLILFFNSHQTSAILVGLLGVVALIAALVVRYFYGIRPFTMSNAEVMLDFMITLKNIAADGSVQNLCWNDAPIPQTQIKEFMKHYIVTIDFPFPLRRWREFPGKLSYEVHDSFPGNPEGLMYVIDFPTKAVSIQVNFPESKLCKTAQAFQTDGVGQKPIHDPQIMNGGKQLRLALRRPRVGSEYSIWWTW